jgi:hypothetical protein
VTVDDTILGWPSNRWELRQGAPFSVLAVGDSGSIGYTSCKSNDYVLGRFRDHVKYRVNVKPKLRRTNLETH